MLIDPHALAWNGSLIWALGAFIAAVGVALVTAIYLHETPASHRWRPRSWVIGLALIGAILGFSGNVLSANRSYLLEAEAKDAEQFARAAADRSHVFAFKPGSSERLIALARRLGPPQRDPMFVNALASRETSVVCGFLVDALVAGGWRVTDHCVAGGLYSGDKEPRTPALVIYGVAEAKRAKALAAALSAEGIETQAIPSTSDGSNLTALQVDEAEHRLGIVLRYL
jgi:hypothetical protein